MTLSELRSKHSALVTLQRPVYNVSPAVRLLAARSAAVIEPQLQAADARWLAAANVIEAAMREEAARHEAAMKQLRDSLQTTRAELEAAEADAVEIPKLPAAEFAKPDTPAELIDVIKPLFDHLSDP